MSTTPDPPFADPPAADAAPSIPFDPVPLRFRHDGWTPERQERFIEVLAASGCVEHAARAVGKSVSSAYALKSRAEAQPFRLAWDAALEMGVKRLSEAALSRAIHGVAQPIFYKGEKVGERRHYDERLTMFLLRYRDPARYGPWIDRAVSAEEPPDAAALNLRRFVNRLTDWLFGGPDAVTHPPTHPAPAEDEGEAADAEEAEAEEEEEDWETDKEKEEAITETEEKDPIPSPPSPPAPSIRSL